MLASRRHGNPRAPHPGPMRRGRGGGAAEASRAHAFLSACGAYGRASGGRDALRRTRHACRGRRNVRDRGRAMLIVMEHDATEEQVSRVVKVIEEMGYQARPMPGAQRTSVGLVGNDGRVDGSRLESLDGVAEVIHVTKPYKQVSREWRGGETPRTNPPGGACGGGG